MNVSERLRRSADHGKRFTKITRSRASLKITLHGRKVMRSTYRRKNNVKFLKSMGDSSDSLHDDNQTHNVDQYVYREISGRMKFKSARMRWVYFVVSNCIPGCSAGALLE